MAVGSKVKSAVWLEQDVTFFVGYTVAFENGDGV
jgi:hypothetical protein